MPSDEYTTVARGALKLKGAKVGKFSKKKTKKDKEKTVSDMERALTTTPSNPASGDDSRVDDGVDRAASHKDQRQGIEEREREEEEQPEDTKTEAERRFAELKRKRVCNELGSV